MTMAPATSPNKRAGRKGDRRTGLRLPVPWGTRQRVTRAAVAARDSLEWRNKVTAWGVRFRAFLPGINKLTTLKNRGAIFL